MYFWDDKVNPEMISSVTGAKNIRKFVRATSTSYIMNNSFKLVPESGPIEGIPIKLGNNYFLQFTTYFFNWIRWKKSHSFLQLTVLSIVLPGK